MPAQQQLYFKGPIHWRSSAVELWMCLLENVQRHSRTVALTATVPIIKYLRHSAVVETETRT